MSVFTVTLPNRCGELACLCEAMADSGINLVLCATTREAEGIVAFIADDEAGAEAVLQDAGLRYATRTALTIRMDNQPGTGAATFRGSPTPASAPNCCCRSASPTACSSR